MSGPVPTASDNTLGRRALRLIIAHEWAVVHTAGDWHVVVCNECGAEFSNLLPDNPKLKHRPGCEVDAICRAMRAEVRPSLVVLLEDINVELDEPDGDCVAFKDMLERSLALTFTDERDLASELCLAPSTLKRWLAREELPSHRLRPVVLQTLARRVRRALERS